MNIQLILESRGQNALDQNSYNVVFGMTHNKGAIFKDQSTVLIDYFKNKFPSDTLDLEKYIYSHATSDRMLNKGLVIRGAVDIKDLKNKTSCNTLLGTDPCHDQNVLRNEVQKVMGKEFVDKVIEISKNNK